MLGGRELLDTEYRGGNWDYLAEDLELPRFSVVAGYCVRHAEGGRILEIGCGEGLLPERIGTSRYARYVGVDISSVAIERAKAKRHPNAKFVAEDASDFDPDAQFDLIVFNEVLEYAHLPVQGHRQRQDPQNLERASPGIRAGGPYPGDHRKGAHLDHRAAPEGL